MIGLPAWIGLGALGKLLGGLVGVSAIPILGPLMAGLWRGLRAIARAFTDGITVCIANPVVLTVIVATFLAGVWQGIAWDKHLVSQARLAVKNEQTTCDMKIVAIETELQKAAVEKRKAAADAVATAPRPETPQEIVELCMRSASCRDARGDR